MRMYYLETSCAIQVRAQAGGGELIHVGKEMLDAAYAHHAGRRRRAGRPPPSCGRACCVDSTAPTTSYRN